MQGSKCLRCDKTPWHNREQCPTKDAQCYKWHYSTYCYARQISPVIKVLKVLSWELPNEDCISWSSCNISRNIPKTGKCYLVWTWSTLTCQRWDNLWVVSGTNRLTITQFVQVNSYQSCGASQAALGCDFIRIISSSLTLIWEHKEKATLFKTWNWVLYNMHCTQLAGYPFHYIRKWWKNYSECRKKMDVISPVDDPSMWYAGMVVVHNNPAQ